MEEGSNGVDRREEPDAVVDVSDIGGEGGVGEVTPVLVDFCDLFRGVTGITSDMTDALSSDIGD